MKRLLDTSVLVSALVDAEAHHEACAHLLGGGGAHVYSQALAETFSTLTGGRLGWRIRPALAFDLIEAGLLPYVKVVHLTDREIIAAMRESEAHGVRGGAFYDFLHLAAARKAGAQRLYTLDVGNFAAFHRSGDPEIGQP